MYEGSTPSRGKRYDGRCKMGKSPRGPARQWDTFQSVNRSNESNPIQSNPIQSNQNTLLYAVCMHACAGNRMQCFKRFLSSTSTRTHLLSRARKARSRFLSNSLEIPTEKTPFCFAPRLCRRHVDWLPIPWHHVRVSAPPGRPPANFCAFFTPLHSSFPFFSLSARLAPLPTLFYPLVAKNRHQLLRIRIPNLLHNLKLWNNWNTWTIWNIWNISCRRR